MRSDRVDRLLHQEVYDWLTTEADVTLTALAAESRAQLNGDNVQPWSVAQGVLRF